MSKNRKSWLWLRPPRRTALLALLLAGAALRTAVPAALGQSHAATASGDVAIVKLLGARVQSVKRHDGGVAVLLPTTMDLDKPDYTASSAKPGSYRLEIDGEEPCNGANVCLYALFTGQRGGKPYGKHVGLSHGIVGSFADIQCGAACSPASIDWTEDGVLYTIEGNPEIVNHPNVGLSTLRAVFVAAADQAIDAAPR